MKNINFSLHTNQNQTYPYYWQVLFGGTIILVAAALCIYSIIHIRHWYTLSEHVAGYQTGMAQLKKKVTDAHNLKETHAALSGKLAKFEKRAAKIETPHALCAAIAELVGAGVHINSCTLRKKSVEIVAQAANEQAPTTVIALLEKNQFLHDVKLVSMQKAMHEGGAQVTFVIQSKVKSEQKG